MSRFSSALTLRELVTPLANPEAGSRLLYVKSDGKIYTKDSNGTEVLAGPASKADIGLGNVPNVDMTNLSNATSGTVPSARLGSGTANSTTFLRGDLQWVAPAGGPPSGAAGGALAGVYPNPTLAAGAVNSAEINAAIKDAAAATASLRTLGTGAQQAAAGNDARLSDARTPLTHYHDAASVNTGVLDIARLPTGSTGTTVSLGNHTHTPAALGAVAKSGDTMTGVLEVPSMAMTPTVGTAKGRFGGLSGVEAWTGMFLNATYVAGNGWLLDDTTKPGWFFKLDSRAASSEFAVYRIPAGAGYHTDEVMMFKVDVNGLMTVMNRVTGVANATGSTDALPKGQADSLYSATGHTHTKANITDLGTIGTAAALNVPASGNAASGEVVKGSDTRLSDARTPTGHVHLIGDLPVASDGGSSSAQIVRANDSRLSNARTPTSHVHATTDVTGLDAAIDARVDAAETVNYSKKFEGRRDTTNQTIPNATPTTVTFNTIVTNPNAWSQSGGTVTVPEAGIYAITGSINFAAAAGFRACTIRCGGQTVAQGNCFDSTSVRNEVSNAIATCTVSLGAGATVEMIAIQTTGANLAVIGQSPAAQVSGTVLRIQRVA